MMSLLVAYHCMPIPKLQVRLQHCINSNTSTKLNYSYVGNCLLRNPSPSCVGGHANNVIVMTESVDVMQFQRLFYCNKLERNLVLKALFSKPDLSTRTENETLQILEQTPLDALHL